MYTFWIKVNSDMELRVLAQILNTERCSWSLIAEMWSMGKYSRTSVLIGYRPRQTWCLSHCDEKKMSRHLALARGSSHLLELVSVTTPPRKRKCFIVRY